MRYVRWELISCISRRGFLTIAICFQEKKVRLVSITDEDIENYWTAINGMYNLCVKSEGDFLLPAEIRCDQIVLLLGAFNQFAEDRDVDSYSNFISAVYETTQRYNPWTTLLYPNPYRYLQEAGIVTRIRGGVESDSTVKFDIFEGFMEEIYSVVQNNTATSGGNPFKEYVFVSDGLCASSCGITSYTTSQLWKNRDRTGATRKASLVSYGGTGKSDDIVFANIPASVQGVQLESLIIGDSALQM